MTDYVDVNGARIERTFLEANVEEARSCEWQRDELRSTRGTHHHCIVCNVSMTEGECYQCGQRCLCQYCHDRFVRN